VQILQSDKLSSILGRPTLEASCLTLTRNLTENPEDDHKGHGGSQTKILENKVGRRELEVRKNLIAEFAEGGAENAEKSGYKCRRLLAVVDAALQVPGDGELHNGELLYCSAELPADSSCLLPML
jgi:hypothetical protein